ncbi:DUF4214 domain-containing protein [Acidithiobacillus ferrivorans]|nr:DUF4214 domain-containing protein [Acidithiobacillus ferrivorans]
MRERSSVEQLESVQREMTTLLQQQAQREQEISAQLLALQQEGHQTQMDLIRSHDEQKRELQQQYTEREYALTQHWQNVQQQTLFEARQAYTHTLQQLQDQLQAESVVRQQEHMVLEAAQQEITTLHRTFAWRLTAPLRSVEGWFNPSPKLAADEKSELAGYQTTAPITHSPPETRQHGIPPEQTSQNPATGDHGMAAKQRTFAISAYARSGHPPGIDTHSLGVAIVNDEHPTNKYTRVNRNKPKESQPMPIQHIIELFALDGQDFITEAYCNLLGREPDPHGMAYYLGRLAMGYGKASVITDLARSAESRPHREIVGLEKLIVTERRANHWLWGTFCRHQRRERLAQQQVSQIAQGQFAVRQLSNDTQAMKHGIVRISHEIGELEQDMRRTAASIESKGSQMNENNRVSYPEKTISKILHRVYFDNFSPFYDPFLHYLETWKRELPNYEIMKWGGRTVDTSANEWLRRSADAKDPVFLSEFVRWDVLRKYGGVYLDADCEVLDGGKFDALVDEMNHSTDYDAFLGVEEFYNGHPTAQTIAAKKGSDLVRFMYDMYANSLSSPLWHWRSERGLIGPQLISLYFRQHGLDETKGFPIELKEPIIVGRVKIYPQDFFSPKFTTCGEKLAVSDNTCIYHLFANLNVKEVDPEAEQHRRNPLLFSEYCDYLANINTEKSIGDDLVDHGTAVGKSRMRDNGLRQLHRIYFGFDGKPDPYKRYLETWVKQMPGYEICHWDATNLPINNCHFSRMMFEFKDHAFLSDYFRWWIMREHGGMYLDADVEILNGQLLDKLITELKNDDNIHAAIGIDSKADGWYTAHSVACKKNSQLAQFMCEIYESLGHLSLWRRKIFYFMAPQMTSLFFATHGWNVDGMGSSPNLQLPVVVEGVKIYPQEWFSPMRPQMKHGFGSFEIDSYTGNTCICHHFSCSWHPDDSPYKSNSNEDNKYKLLDELLNIGA